MLLTTKGRYAIMAVLDIAQNNNNCTVPVSLSQISERHGISVSYLEQIFMKLKKANIVMAIRGPGGGYILAKPSNQIALIDVLDAVGEIIRATKCHGIIDSCNHMVGKCITHNLWSKLDNYIYSYLSSISLLDVIQNKFP